MSFQRVVLYNEIQKLIDFSNSIAASKGISLQVNYSPELPRKVSLDSIRLKQVFLPLLRHALRSCNAGDIILIQFGEHVAGGKKELMVKIGVKEGVRMSQNPALQAIESLARDLGSTGLEIRPTQLSFTMFSEKDYGNQAKEEDLQLSGDEEHQRTVPQGISIRTKS